MSPSNLFQLLFGLRAPVHRVPFVVAGAVFFTLKYAADAALAWFVLGQTWSPIAYLNPVFSMRTAELGIDMADGASAFTIGSLLLSIPFLWIGISMTVRRVIDAGLPGLLAILFFVPGINYMLFALLAFMPSAPQRQFAETTHGHPMTAALKGVAVGVLISLGMVVLSVFAFGEYGASLFVAAPVLIGFFAAYFQRRAAPVSLMATVGVMTVALIVCAGMLILFMLEGVMCVAMAFPIGWVMGLVGAVFGRVVAGSGQLGRAPAAAMVSVLPLLLGFESAHNVAPERELITTVEVNAPPDVVWRNIIAWREIDQADLPFVFRAGIAYPVRARIEGTGVGAVRYCEFSTGPFVEPITVWDPPSRLSFDVASQPPGMTELSPWPHVHAPHLENYMVSHRGEFRLVELPGGRTRLEGSTWYHVDVWPQAYWGMYADQLLHAIHLRVLEHIGEIAEAEAGR